tara:strand:- start:273 stop:425 length:153 start_codon:yes stop_codon:yes gene_type:complete
MFVDCYAYIYRDRIIDMVRLWGTDRIDYGIVGIDYSGIIKKEMTTEVATS